MITYSIIQKSQLEGSSRLDAEYYQPEYLEVRKKIVSLKTVTLGQISSKFKKGIFDIKANTYTEDGIPFIRISNLKDGLIDERDIVFISEEANTKEKSTQLLKDDIVLSKTAYPAASLITFPKVNISQDIIGVSISSNWREKLLPSYINIFLNSKFGLSEMEQWFQGNIQMHLALPDAKTILIPVIALEKQQEFSSLFENSEQELINSKKLYQQAEDLLLKALGLGGFKPREDLSFIVNISEVQEVNRSDPDFFQPKYSNLIKRIGKVTKLLSIVIKRKTDSIRVDPEKEYNYIEISDINVGTGGLNYNKVIGQELPANAKLKISGGELLVSKVRPTRGAVAILPEEWQEDFIASGAFSVFETNSPNREYLQVVLRSIIGRLQLEKPTTGTSYPTVTDEDIENVLVPIVSSSLKTKIADLVKKSHEARSKAKQLIEEAKRRVENLIEMR